MADVLHPNLAESAALSRPDAAPRQLLFAAALMLVTFIAYIPAIRAGFIWDDDWYVTGNLALRDWRGLATIWFDPPTQLVHRGQIPQYYPMTHTSFWLEYRLWGDRPMGYHITNVLLHSANAVLVALILRKLGMPGAWLAGAIFALHPVHVESVAWITERKNVLSGVFYLSSLLFYLQFLDNKRRAIYATSLLLFISAVLSKSVAASLPAAILLIVFWKRRRITLADVTPLLPFFMIGILMARVTSWIERNVVGARGPEWDFAPTILGEFLYRSIIAGKAIWFYVLKLLWPASLAFSYPRWEIDTHSMGQYAWPIAALLTVIVLFTFRRRIGHGPAVAILFFGGTLLPALGYFNIYPMRYSFVADHFQYLASVGLIALFAAMLTLVARRATNTRYADLVPYLLLVPLAVLTWRQAGIYYNLETLWSGTIAKNPSSWLAHSNFGILLASEGRADEAEPHLLRAWDLRNQAGTATHLGAIAELRGNVTEAITWYERALQLEPDANAMSMLGRLRGGEAGAAMIADAIERDPANPVPHTQLGLLYESMGDRESAAASYQRAMELDPSYHMARTNFANLLLLIGEARDAAAHLRIVLADQPRNAAALNGMGVAMAQLGDFSAAEKYFRAALDSRPNFAAAQQNLDRLLTGAATRMSQ